MTANYLHRALKRETVPLTRIFDSKEQDKVDIHNSNYEAFWTRIIHVTLTERHEGTTKFPYESVNLAHFLADYHKEQQRLVQNIDVLNLEDNNDSDLMLI